MNLGALLDQGLTYVKVTKETSDSDYRRFCIETLNELQRTAMTMCEPAWGIREWKFITTTAHIAGTLRVTNGAALVTETTSGNNSFSDTLVGRKLVVANRLEWYEVVEHVTGAVGGFRIDPPYQGSSGTAETYGIYQDEYDLPGDFRALVSLRNELVPRRVQYRDAWLQDHRIPRTFWSSTSNNFAPYVDTIQTRERKPITWSTTGTMSVSYASDRITFSNFGNSTATTDDPRYRGATVRLSGTTTVVQIRNIISVATAGGVTTATAMMYEPWKGQGGLLHTGFELVPKGNWRITLWPVPNTATVMHARYYFHPEPMIVYEDVPCIPVQHHDYLWLGLAYRMSSLSGAPEAQAQREGLYRDWKESESRMLSALSPNQDSIIQRQRFGRPGWPSWDGPLLPDNFPAQWAQAGVGDDQPWPI